MLTLKIWATEEERRVCSLTTLSFFFHVFNHLELNGSHWFHHFYIWSGSHNKLCQKQLCCREFFREYHTSPHKHHHAASGLYLELPPLSRGTLILTTLLINVRSNQKRMQIHRQPETHRCFIQEGIAMSFSSHLVQTLQMCRAVVALFFAGWRNQAWRGRQSKQAAEESQLGDWCGAGQPAVGRRCGGGSWTGSEPFWVTCFTLWMRSCTSSFSHQLITDEQDRVKDPARTSSLTSQFFHHRATATLSSLLLHGARLTSFVMAADRSSLFIPKFGEKVTDTLKH